MSNPYRGLPSVDRLLQHRALTTLRERYPEALVTAHARAALERSRQAIRRSEAPAGGDSDDARSGDTANVEEIVSAVVVSVEDVARPSLRAVINASGVVLHTNLGRAPLSTAAIAAMAEAGRSYSNLEFNLAAGERGARLDHLEGLLQATTGAEAGIAVNNNASALLLVLSALAGGREVIVSRGQAVEIGGSFRIPDVCRQSGATLVEVGTTNRTRAGDYAAAISEETAAVLRVHASNFKIVGFTEQPSLAELRAVSSERGVLFLDDVGSGCLLDTTRYGLAMEPTPQESVAAGADLVLFSGDKLLGGPQAGIMVGRRDLVEELKQHPLARVLRMDKATIAGLAATLQHYLLGEAEEQVPVWRMISAPAERLRERADGWRAALGTGLVEESESMVGGGALPGESLPTFVLTLPHREPHRLAARLRGAARPVVGRVEREALRLDPRAVPEDEDAALLSTLREALAVS